jgi:hypothetical protein
MWQERVLRKHESRGAGGTTARGRLKLPGLFPRRRKS